MLNNVTFGDQRNQTDPWIFFGSFSCPRFLNYDILQKKKRKDLLEIFADASGDPNQSVPD